MTQTANKAGKTRTVPLDYRNVRDIGTATFTPLDSHGVTVYVVTVNERAGDHFGGPQGAARARTTGTLGGIVKIRGKWDVTAYESRDHLRTHPARVYGLGECRTQAGAARMLLAWWGLMDRGQVAPGCDLYNTDPDRGRVFSQADRDFIARSARED